MNTSQRELVIDNQKQRTLTSSVSLPHIKVRMSFSKVNVALQKWAEQRQMNRFNSMGKLNKVQVADQIGECLVISNQVEPLYQ